MDLNIARIRRKHYELALFFFNNEEMVARARAADDPVKYLVEQAAGYSAAFAPDPIYGQMIGFERRGSRVYALGVGEGRTINWTEPLFSCSVETLARIRLTGMYQETFDD